MSKAASALVLAGALQGAASILAATPAIADDTKGRCYGVSFKRQDDRAVGIHSCAVGSTADFDPSSFKLVLKGTCTTIKLPNGRGAR